MGPKRPEKLPKHTYREFYMNSDKTNKSELRRLTISKVILGSVFYKRKLCFFFFQVEDMEDCWTMEVKKRHGVIITEIDGEIEVSDSMNHTKYMGGGGEFIRKL